MAATEIVQMVVDPTTLDTTNPIVAIGGNGAPRNMTVKIPLDYKDPRVPQPFRSGGYDQRVSSEGLIGDPRICTIHFDELYDATCPNYRAVYDKYITAFGEGQLVGLIFRTTDGFQRVRNARLLSMPWQSDKESRINAVMDMTFAVDFYSRDLFPPGAAIFGASTAKFGTSKYGTSGLVLPLKSTTLNGATSIGATSFTLISATGMAIGTTLTLGTGATIENIVIANIVGNVVTGATPAVFAHANGETAVTNSMTFVNPGTVAVNSGVMTLYGPIPPCFVTLYWNNGRSSNGFQIAEALNVQGSGYIDYYQIDAGTETIIKNGVEIFDLTKFVQNKGQNEFFVVPKGTVTIVVTPTPVTFGATSALYLNYTALYI